jgi:hypothetical protein
LVHPCAGCRRNGAKRPQSVEGKNIASIGGDRHWLLNYAQGNAPDPWSVCLVDVGKGLHYVLLTEAQASNSP